VDCEDRQSEGTADETPQMNCGIHIKRGVRSEAITEELGVDNIVEYTEI
jgi:hypothetical protein